MCAPDDGWGYHPKHVEQFPDINCVSVRLVDIYWNMTPLSPALPYLLWDLCAFMSSMHEFRDVICCVMEVKEYLHIICMFLYRLDETSWQDLFGPTV